MRRLTLALTLLLASAVLAPADEQVHVLERGQTIYTLARRYGVSAADLIEYNGIDDPTRLPIGARIRIPGTYTVKDGEYIYSIARDIGVDWIELLELNGMGRNDVVRPGDVILIPRRATGTASRSPEPVADQPEDTDDAETATPSDPEPNPVAVLPPEAITTVDWPHPGDRETWNGRFKGVVMTGQAGDVFRSVASGVVSFVGPFTSFGKLILVRSEDGYLYGYAGADTVNVTQGQFVSNGTVLGSVGVSPAFQSARVLFTVWRDNRYIDPEQAPRG